MAASHLDHDRPRVFTAFVVCRASAPQYYTSLLLYEPYANESSQICPFLAVRPQFESVRHQNRRLSSHLYSHESVIFFVFLGLICFKLRRFCFFWVYIHAARLLQPLQTITAGQSIILR